MIKIFIPIVLLLAIWIIVLCFALAKACEQDRYETMKMDIKKMEVAKQLEKEILEGNGDSRTPKGILGGDKQ